MWTPAARAQLARPALPYATCLTDAEWALAEPLLPPPAPRGRVRRWPMRTILDGIFYVLRTGGAWRHLPRDFPPWQTVLRWFLSLSRSGTFERMAHALTIADRERVGRDASPSAAVVDAQAARSGGVGVSGVRGYDAAKRVVGRKRYALVDTDGRLRLAAVLPASLHDSHGGIALLRTSRRPWPFLKLRFADRAYAGPRVAAATLVTVPSASSAVPRRRAASRSSPADGSSSAPSAGRAAVAVSPATTRPPQARPPSSQSPPQPSYFGALHARYEAGTKLEFGH